MTPPGRSREGRVLEAAGGFYLIQLEEGRRVEARLRGRLKRIARTGDRVVAGEKVAACRDRESRAWTIEAVRERDNELVRAGPGGRRPKVVVANVDRLFVVLSAVDPPLAPRTADRFLILGEACGIPPVLVVNKLDLPRAARVAEAAASAYATAGYEVLVLSARTGAGLEAVRRRMGDGVSVLIGPSGVGKSTILNALFPGLGLRTAEVSRRGGRGRHTTVSARLFGVAPGAWVADTPGFSDVTLWGVDPARLSDAFPEFRTSSSRCRFRGCTHSHEPDCAVEAAVSDGRIARARYESYLALLGDA